MTSSDSNETRTEPLSAALHVERERAAFVLENIAEEVYFMDTAGRYTFANAAALREFGHRSVEGVEVSKIISHMLVLRADGSVRPMEEAPPLRALAGELIHHEEQLLRTPRSGELRRRQVSAAPVRDPRGRIVGSMAIVRDVSPSHRTQTQAPAGSAAVPSVIPASGASARNVEVKARIGQLVDIEERVRALAEQGPFELLQDDTFFACSSGRLKLRELAPDRGEMIFYRRPDVPGPKLSEYTIAPTPAPALLRAALGDALGVVGRVRKRRRLYLAGATRIHLDEVEGLGAYLELEVVLLDSQSSAQGEDVARHWLSQLGVGPEALVCGAYVDLLRGAGGG